MSYKKSTEKRQQILDCAKHLFAERGYQAAQIADICDELHIARGTVYQYFDNKEDLFRTILTEYFERIGKNLDSAEIGEDFAADGVPSLEIIRELLVNGTEQFLLHMYRDRDIGRIILFEGLYQIPDVAKIVGEFFAERKARAIKYLEIGVALGLVRKIDIQLIATAMQGTVSRVILDHIINGNINSEQQLHEMAVELVNFQLNGILP